jgi:hypothetical protein
MICAAVFGLVLLGFALRPRSEQETRQRCEVTLDQYNRLKNGMTHSEVTGMIGCEGTAVSRYEVSNVETVLFIWLGNGYPGSHVILSFQGGRVVATVAGGGLH